MKILVRSVVGRVFTAIKEDPRILLPYFLVYLLSLGVSGIIAISPSLAFLKDDVAYKLVYNLSARLLELLAFLCVLIYAYHHLEELSVNISQILSLIIRKFFRLLGLIFLIFLINFFFIVIVVIPFALTIFLAVISKESPLLMLFVSFVGGAFSLVVLIYVIRTAIRLFSFPYIALLFEDLSPIKALGRSTEVVDKDFWAVIRAILVVGLAAFLSLFISTFLIAFFILLGGLFRLPAGFLVFFDFVVLVIFFSLLSSFSTALMMVLFKSLAAQPEKAEKSKLRGPKGFHINLATILIFIIVVVVIAILAPKIYEFAAQRSSLPKVPAKVLPSKSRILSKSMDFTLKDLNGKSHTLSDYKGKIVFLNFWATWCPPCRSEMPSMQRLYDSWDKKKFVMLAVNINEASYKVKSFADKNGYTFPILLDEKRKVATKYNIRSIPTTFILDEEGNVINKIIGSREWTLKDLLQK